MRKLLPALCGFLSCMRNRLRKFGVLFFNALVFLTRLPAPSWVPFHTRLLQLSALHFPLVGVVVGLIMAACLLFLSLFFPIDLAVVLMMCLGVLLTGAFHEDGWADSCDALGGGRDKENVLRIMKDSRLGSYGAIGLIGLLAVKALALVALAENLFLMCLTLVFAQGASRWFALTVISRLTYVRDASGKAKALAHRIGFRNLCLAAIPLVLTGLCAIALSELTLPVLILVMLFAYGSVLLFSRQLKRSIGGYTGDGLGAVQQLSEVMLYLGVLVVLRLFAA